MMLYSHKIYLRDSRGYGDKISNCCLQSEDYLLLANCMRFLCLDLTFVLEKLMHIVISFCFKKILNGEYIWVTMIIDHNLLCHPMSHRNSVNYKIAPILTKNVSKFINIY